MKRVETLNIDGSAGEGGGQILRTSLALSLITGRPFRITGIRAKRKKPGLLRQHLTAVQAAIRVGNAVADGAEMASSELVFRPEKVQAGEHRFSVGTAGSTTLVLQTILPPLALAGAKSRVVLEGGTHNPFAPPFDYLARTFLPHFCRFGPQVEATLARPGFYPAGGGRLEVEITPVRALKPIEILERGEDLGRRVVAHIAALSPGIAERAFGQFTKRMGWPREVCELVTHPQDCGPGFYVCAELLYGNTSEVFSGFGEKGVTSERVADAVIDEVRHYLGETAPVAEHLSDQLLLPLALAGGGAFRTRGLSLHARTNIDVIEQFLPVKFETSPAEGGGTVVRVAQ